MYVLMGIQNNIALTFMFKYNADQNWRRACLSQNLLGALAQDYRLTCTLQLSWQACYQSSLCRSHVQVGNEQGHDIIDRR